MSKSKLFLRRVIAFAGAVIITINIAAAPQRARAVAVTASVVASVAAIMAACGVTYWAASQTDAIDYLGGRIDAYLGSLETVPQSYEDWLGIDAASQLFEVVSGGVMSFGSGVANKVLDFVRWFNSEEGVASGGDAVVEYDLNTPLETVGTPPQGTVSASYFNENTILLDYSNCKDTQGGHDYGFSVGLPAPNVRVFMAYSSYGRYAFSNSKQFYVFLNGTKIGQANMTAQTYLDISGNVGDTLTYLAELGSSVSNGTFRLEFLGTAFGDPLTRVTPSDAVAVPDDVAEGSSFDVTPSVALTQGMTVDQASEAVLDGVASEDGLTSEGEAVEGATGSWGWLEDLLERIRQAVVGTQEAVESNHEAVQGMQEAVEGTQQAVEGTQEAVEGMQDAVEGIEHAVQPAQYSAIGSYQLNLTNFFPFCIPWDLFRGLSLLVAEPVAPSIDWEVPLPNDSTYTLSLDFSEFDGVAQVARTMELLAFVVALAVATKKLIKW